MPSFQHSVGVSLDAAIFGLLTTHIRMTYGLLLHATVLDVDILSCMRFPVLTCGLFRAVRVIAFACEAAAAHHPDRLRNALFEGFYDGAFLLVLVVLYGIFKKW